MKITIERGTHQIGGCATVISTENHRIVIDCGANLPNTDMENSMTDAELLDRLFHSGEPCDGVLFSHYHGDHIGLYKEIPEEYPLYMGATAKKIMEELTGRIDALPSVTKKGLPRIQGAKTFFPKEKLDFGDIKVTPFVGDHSALDAYMFLIEAGGKRILFTGDFREHGVAGEKDTLEKMLKTYVGKVDILITEGTMLARTEERKKNPIQTEEELGRRAEEFFRENKITVVLVSSTNLDSIMEFYHAVPWNKAFVCDAYQAKLMQIAMEAKGKYFAKYRKEMIHGNPRRIYIVGDMEGLGAEQDCYPADFSILKDKGFVMLARENKPRFQKIVEYFQDPMILYSKWSGYLEGKHQDQNILDFIGNHRMEPLHTSGHAYVETIEKLIRMTDPEVIIPMHTEFAKGFQTLPEFAAYWDRVQEKTDGEEYNF